MSMNKYMHPRNIYKMPPDFKQLALEYPEFQNHVKLDVSGKVSINFKDVEALRALSCTLLKKDFGLNVNIPTNKLIPTIPLRFNYVLWIEDLLSIANCTNAIKGIDIGTGASCVYPLIAAKKYNWFMLATENDIESIKSAENNVKNNNLKDLIRVINIKGDSLLLEAVNNTNETFDFCMCNPPFFSHTKELHSTYRARKLSRPKPKNAFCASVTEVVSKGGEVEFVSKIIQESKQLNNRIRIYTSMIGQKSSLTVLKKLLREVDVVSFKQTEFCQGNTTRWGLAWTFCDIDLRKIPQMTLAALKKDKTSPYLYHVIDNTEEKYCLQDINNKLINIFNELQMDYQVQERKSYISFIAKAYQNTWSHQRRKKREQKRIQAISQEMVATPVSCMEQPNEKNDFDITIAEDLKSMKVNSPPNKRHLEEEEIDEFYNVKKFRNDNNNSTLVYLEFKLTIQDENKKFLLELLLLKTSKDKDALNQVLQYIKNNLNM